MKTLVQLAALMMFAAWLQRLEIDRANERAYQVWYVQQELLRRKAIARLERSVLGRESAQILAAMQNQRPGLVEIRGNRFEAIPLPMQLGFGYPIGLGRIL